MFLSLHLRFDSNSLIAFNPCGASVDNAIANNPQTLFCIFWLDLYHVEHSLTKQLFGHRSLLLNGLFLH